MKLQLENTCVLVTGGTAGIGKAIVDRFLSEGATVAYCSRHATGTEFNNSNAFGRALDITDREALEIWVNEVAETFGSIDVVVSNVSALAITDTPENWSLAYQTDLEAAVNLIKFSMPHLLRSKRSPNIVMISTISASNIDFSSPGPYGPLKAALIHHTQGIAKKYAPMGVRANVVSPGNIYVKDGIWGDIERNNPTLFRATLAANPMGRLGSAEEIADAVLFLASRVSSFTTGANFIVDGGASHGVHF